jgi:wobble nucleotide-excising tRNase
MGKTLTEIAQQLKDSNKRVQLIYAFNGVGKTRLSREFRLLVAPKIDQEDIVQDGRAGIKVLYYNAFTEDLFYWDNDLENDLEPRLKIQPNSFTEWVLNRQGQDQKSFDNFQHYTNPYLTPKFSADFLEATFSIARGDDENIENIKLSKGEESNLIWCVFYSLMEQIISELNIADVTNRSTDEFNNLEYIIIDDPVSSLDEIHLIELAVNISELIKSNESQNLKFIISTHSPLFYNVLYNEIGAKFGYLLSRNEDGTFILDEKQGDSNKSFSYHLHLKKTIEQAIVQNSIQKYHFTLLRNLYEKTAQFLGYPEWSELLPDDKKTYLNRIIQFTIHSTLSNEVAAQPTEPEKQIVSYLLKHLVSEYSFWQEAVTHD